jgi:hypothetical protein
MESKEIRVKQSAKDMCETRDQIMGLITQALDKLGEAEFLLKTISSGTTFSFDRNCFFQPSNPANQQKTVENLRKQTDRKVWDHIINLGEFRNLMSVKEQRKVDEALLDVPPVTYETVVATFTHLLNSRGNMLHDLIETAFLERNKSYKSNSGNKVNRKHVIESVFCKYGYANYGSYATNRLDDITKAISILTGLEAPHVTNILTKQNELIAFNGAVKYRAFKKGTVHVQIVSNELLDKINDALANAMGAKIGAA